MKKSLLIAGAAIVAAAVPAIAATTQAPPRAHASAMHAPAKDITRAEVEAKVKEHFTRFDTNKDGVVTKEEISARRDAMRAQWQDERFKALDKDGNGSISRAEFDAGHQARGAKRPDGTPPSPGAEAGKGGHGARHHGMGGRGAGAMKGGMMAFHLVDADKDGKVTLAEATSGALARFDRMDANKDGKITAQERRDGMKQMREEWRKDGSPRRDAPPPAASKPS